MSEIKNEKESSIMDILNRNPKNEALSSDQFNPRILLEITEYIKNFLDKKGDDEKEVQLKTIELEAKANEQNFTIAIETLRDEMKENSSFRSLRLMFSLMSVAIIGSSIVMIFLDNPMGEKVLYGTLAFISGIFIGRGSVKAKKDES
ncbi:hypothetical protein [Leptospira interrogans]|uniref:hypothetical protein n=1 Tax=Leptospira interrogans TaxID=173 RepID=UPI0002BBDDB5|nr:hypothetical protein [Leptospira interrogans]EMN94740.1 hypothetical protein LEP1GSC110_3372 [Leptospira interrogans serovar Medanensis str. UT053]EMO02037.1 hypothetical protein LEP1GSC112_0325 [Leptospira interrogans serovar Pomona str. UT364]EMO96222.1 hypothetical protein LEP1GSC109_0066 [Leptospira interrogans str. UI 13372]QCO35630.1 hypothetical protein E4414_21720 [Leptospira interrogans]UMQ52630.1 hypothetical protein FH582_02045 [Leptospira interrogans]